MAKTKKKKIKLEPLANGLKLLEVGDKVLYMGPGGIIDLTEVVARDERTTESLNPIATLKNGIRCLSTYDKSKILAVLGKSSASVLVWGKQAKIYYDTYILKCRYKSTVEKLQKLNFPLLEKDKLTEWLDLTNELITQANAAEPDK